VSDVDGTGRPPGQGLPLTVTVTAGTGRGPTELAAFDAALQDAGVANYNLVRLSSVLPLGSTVVVGAGPQAPSGGWGDVLYCVYAERRAARRGTGAYAGIGWVRDATSGAGLFVEHDGSSRAEVQDAIAASLDDMTRRRGRPLGPVHSVVVGEVCADLPVCALVVATYGTAPWTHLVPGTAPGAALVPELVRAR
jgi:arginine decarboxylase